MVTGGLDVPGPLGCLDATRFELAVPQHGRRRCSRAPQVPILPGPQFHPDLDGRRPSDSQALGLPGDRLTHLRESVAHLSAIRCRTLCP